ncbi:MAG: DNA alkylation repair protein [Bdellovibrionaceae bacterium]|jgi:3-methyladenine DNA glycosylase AlkC|nr:DNA alkylation repair protein [Pseudobdellovibrionaceae bacterium]
MEPFKNLLSKKLILEIAHHISKHVTDFDEKGFIKFASKDLSSLELKQRSSRITEALEEFLPSDFESSASILLASLGNESGQAVTAGETTEKGLSGWAMMPMADYVAFQGQGHFNLSMNLLKEMTKRFSSEFAIRHFLIQSPNKTLKVLKKWSKDKEPHVRRLASEGSRPRLPWAKRLPEFISDPQPILEILELLKDDESEYVRRSVANSLNDISKDHPHLVSKIAAQWLVNPSEHRRKLVRHACRSLLKSGHTKTLRAFGYKLPKVDKVKIRILNNKVKFGGVLEFELKFSSTANKSQPLMIDYIVHHQKSNGTTSPKVFKWKVVDLQKGKDIHAIKKHPMKKITTRVYYPGQHSLEIVVNGISMGKSNFQLLM